MKSFFILSILFLTVACDPYGFGFKKNPAYVLDEAFQAITNLDSESYIEVTGKEALCVYGNEQGLHYLKTNVVLTPENVKLKPTVLKTVHNQSPKYVGYWSYYSERYQIDIQDKVTSALLMKTYVDCEYGTDGDKNAKFINLKPQKYRVKECRVVKVIPEIFKPLPIPAKCDKFTVEL